MQTEQCAKLPVPHPGILDLRILSEECVHVAAKLLHCDELIELVVVDCPGK